MFLTLRDLIKEIFSSHAIVPFVIISGIHIMLEVGTVYYVGTGIGNILVGEIEPTLVLFVALVLVVNSFGSLFFQTFLTYFSFDFGNRLSHRYVEACTAFKKDTFESKGQSYLVKNSVAEMVRISEWIITPFALGIVKLLISFGIILVLAFNDLITTLIMCCGLTFSYFLIYFICAPINKRLGQRLTEFLDDRSILGNDILSSRFLVNENVQRQQFDQLKRMLHTEAITRSWGTLIAFLPKNILETVSIVALLGLIYLADDGSARIEKMMLYGFAGYRLLPAFQAVYYGVSRTVFNLGIYQTIKEEISTIKKDSIFFEKSTSTKYNFPGGSINRSESKINLPYFTLNPGQLVLVKGNSGSGKSSLLETIIGYEDRLIDKSSKVYIVSDTILIPQNLPNLSIKISSILSKQNWKVFQFLKDINYLPDRRLSEYSGGQLQRILLAHAILSKKKFIILDEGLSGINVELERLALKELKKYLRNYKAFGLVTTHRTSNLDIYDKELDLNVV